VIEWREFCVGAPDVVPDDAGVDIQFSNGRRQRIDVRPGDGVIELRGVVARRAVALQIERLALVAWERNRASSLVGFRMDDRGRLVGESWVPTHGLTRDEFLFYLRSAAAACDLFEYQLTGKDLE
jgi:Putative bacterial sensory transduction regulator